MLAAFGGFEIAMMVGVMLVAASKRHLLMVDGMAACAALMLASRIATPVTDYCVFCRSHGHRGLDKALHLFRASALLELGMDSTDGTGATLAWPLVRSAAALLTEVADGEDPGPSRPTPMADDSAAAGTLSAALRTASAAAPPARQAAKVGHALGPRRGPQMQQQLGGGQRVGRRLVARAHSRCRMRPASRRACARREPGPQHRRDVGDVEPGVAQLAPQHRLRGPVDQAPVERDVEAEQRRRRRRRPRSGAAPRPDRCRGPGPPTPMPCTRMFDLSGGPRRPRAAAAPTSKLSARSIQARSPVDAARATAASASSRSLDGIQAAAFDVQHQPALGPAGAALRLRGLGHMRRSRLQRM